MMRGAWTVARREVRGYFDQPTAYVLIVAFLGLSLFLAFRSLYASGSASLRPLFDLLPILFAVFVPAATMRTLAEERRGKTLEWLLAQPLEEAEVVVGKFLGDWLFVAIALAGTVPTALGVLVMSEADPGIIAAQYIGALLLAAQFVAIGLWASSITRNQITAFIVAAALCFTLFLIGLPVAQIGLPPAISGALARLSVVSHFENVARGVVDLRDVLYFVSTAGLFIVLALGAISRDRLSHGRPEYARLRIGALVATALVVALNLLGSYIRGRIDLTADNLYTLADGTRDILGELDDLVQIKLYASAELPPEVQLQLRDVEFQVRRGYYGLAVVYADEQEVFPIIQRTDDLEFRLASAIYGMTTDTRAGVAFVEGFGTKSQYEIPALQEGLSDRYEIRTIDIAGDSAAAIPRDSTEVLVVAGPTQALDEAAVGRVRDFVAAGGSALLLLEPIMLDQQSPTAIPVRSGLEPLVEEHGMGFRSTMVLDLASSERVSLGRRGIFNVISSYPLWPVTFPASDHAIIRGLNSLTLGWAGDIEIQDSTRVTPLWQTSEAGGTRGAGLPIMPDQDWDLPEEELGVHYVAAAYTPPEGEPGGRLVVVSDATFLEDQFLRSNPGNLVFVANAINWLAQDEALIRIRSKNRTPPQLVFASDAGRNLLKWGNLVGIPLLFALVGMVRVTGRRRRAEARWKEVVS